MAPLAMGVDMAAHMGAATVVPTAVLILALEGESTAFFPYLLQC